MIKILSIFEQSFNNIAMPKSTLVSLRQSNVHSHHPKIFTVLVVDAFQSCMKFHRFAVKLPGVNVTVVTHLLKLLRLCTSAIYCLCSESIRCEGKGTN